MYYEQTEIVIIGAGIVGLAISERLSSNHGVVVLERHAGFGREASSRNSQVIHAGIYYPTGSLKARLCVDGSRMLYEFCDRHSIETIRTGKIIPGIDDDEVERVRALFDLGMNNGVDGLRMLSSSERSELASEVLCTEAMFSPATGIVDAHAVMSALEGSAKAQNAVFAYGTNVDSVERDSGRWLLIAKDPDGGDVGVRCDAVINAAGISADRLAATAGIDIVDEDYVQVPCKGEYFRVAASKNGCTSRLVYPADSARMIGTIAQGVHLVQELDGSMRIGPNTLYGSDDLDVDESHADAFFSQMRRFLPWLESMDLHIDSAGVRAMRSGVHEQIRDFFIREESDRGMPGLINLIAMESPALTSSLAIAEYVEGLL